jgi:hypothetical protein
MDIEKNSSLPFVDVMVNTQPDGTLGHTVFWKPTHTDLYLHAISEHRLAQKKAVLSTLINRDRTICDSGSSEEEMEHPKKTFRKNGKRSMETKRALHPNNKHKTRETKPTTMAIIPCMRTISGKISRLPAKHNIKTIHRPVKKTNNL